MFDQTSLQHVRETPIPGKPEVARLVPRDGIHFFAGYAIYGDKPAVLQVNKSVTCGHPDSPTIILEQRLYRLIWQSICFAENCSSSIFPPSQPVVSGHPNAPICGCEHRRSIVTGQTLFHRNSCDGELSKPVESPSGRDPDIAFTILEKAGDDVS